MAETYTLTMADIVALERNAVRRYQMAIQHGPCERALSQCDCTIAERWHSAQRTTLAILRDNMNHLETR